MHVAARAAVEVRRPQRQDQPEAVEAVGAAERDATRLVAAGGDI